MSLLVKKGEDLYHNIDITFEESIKGSSKKILIKKKHRCGDCRGSRCQQNTVPTKCWTCKGKGITFLKNGPYLEEEKCFNCGGFGMVIKHKCPLCDGKGLIEMESLEELKIPPLTTDNQVLTFEHKGHQATSSYNGTLYLTVLIRNEAHVKRERLNLVYDIKVNYLTCLFGGRIKFKGVYNEVELIIPENTLNNYTFVKKHEGAFDQNTDKRGDMIVNVLIEIPNNLSNKEREFYNALRNFE